MHTLTCVHTHVFMCDDNLLYYISPHSGDLYIHKHIHIHAYTYTVSHIHAYTYTVSEVFGACCRSMAEGELETSDNGDQKDMFMAFIAEPPPQS
jgi:hypothetical protein